MSKLYEDHPSMFRNNPIGFIVSVILIPIGVGLIILLVWYLKCKASTLSIDENDILYEKGLLSKERSEVNIISVRTIRVKQSFFNRIFGVGTIEIFTTGDEPEIVAVGMPDPNKVREIIKVRQNQDD